MCQINMMKLEYIYTSAPLQLGEIKNTNILLKWLCPVQISVSLNTIPLCYYAYEYRSTLFL